MASRSVPIYIIIFQNDVVCARLYDFVINRTKLSLPIRRIVLVKHLFFSNFACYEKIIFN